jgi:glycosyltransferase involved in cell wall biosynthesis
VIVTGPVTDLAVATRRGRGGGSRAGGRGSRIKLLEALAYTCPVVSTSVGAEGIVVRHGSELLIADGAADFAAACARVLERPGPVRAMVRRGRDFVARRHSPAAVLRRLRAARRLTGDGRQARPP